MSNARTTGAAPSISPVPHDLEGLASSALAAVIDSGAKILMREPWRAARIVRGADAMTIGELAFHVARRRRAPPADLNRGIALAQLSLALAAPGFGAAWADWRAAQDAE
ncbi:MAG: hypothetical protein ACLQE9_17120 [Roseiarcus sp.]